MSGYDTNLGRVARAYAQRAEVGYQAALTEAHAASEAGLLPRRLDKAGRAAAVRILLAAGGSRPAAALDCALRDPDLPRWVDGLGEYRWDGALWVRSGRVRPGAGESARPGFEFDPELPDADPYSLCTPAGVVDLRTGDLAAADPRVGFHSKVTSVAPQRMDTPLWDVFLAFCFGDDAAGRERVTELQRCLARMVTGVPGREWVLVSGPGPSGKSVLSETIIALLGTYARERDGYFPSVASRAQSAEVLSVLQGVRLLHLKNEGLPGRADQLRSLRRLASPGGYVVVDMHGSRVEFNRTHSLWVECLDDDRSVWRRPTTWRLTDQLGPDLVRYLRDEGVRVDSRRRDVSVSDEHWAELEALRERCAHIELVRQVPADAIIPGLSRLIVEEEGPGVLQWLVDGARVLLKEDQGARLPS